jgi:hemerythrin-like domain-containing protein
MLNECGYEIVHIDSVILPIIEEQLRDDISAMNLNCYEEIMEHFKKTDAESYIYVAEARIA